MLPRCCRYVDVLHIHHFKRALVVFRVQPSRGSACLLVELQLPSYRELQSEASGIRRMCQVLNRVYGDVLFGDVVSEEHTMNLTSNLT